MCRKQFVDFDLMDSPSMRGCTDNVFQTVDFLEQSQRWRLDALRAQAEAIRSAQERADLHGDEVSFP